MKACTSCGTKVEDDVMECPVCCDTQFENICPSCSSPLEGDHCPVCGYLTDAAAARMRYAKAYPVSKPLENINKNKYGEYAIIHAVLGLLCPVFIFQIVAIIYAVKALKLGDSFKTPFIAMIIAVIGIIVSVLVIEMFSPMIFYNMN